MVPDELVPAEPHAPAGTFRRMTGPSSDGSTPTLREVYTLISSLRAELLAEIKGVAGTVDAKLTAHQSEHQQHDAQHAAEAKARSGLIRWAVTSILTGLGVLTAIYVAFAKAGG